MPTNPFDLEYILSEMEKELDKAFKEGFERSKEYIEKAYNSGVKKGEQDLKIAGISFNTPPDPFALEFLNGYQLDLIKGISDDMKKEVKRVIRDGLINGKGMREVAKDLRKVYKTKQWRLNTIARTEVMRASNFGRYNAWKKSGVVKAKEWLTAFDDRTCPECALMNGEVVALEQRFSNGVYMPPAHPNCRCTAIPIVKKTEFRAQFLPKRELRVRSIESGYSKLLIKTFNIAFKHIIRIWYQLGSYLYSSI